MKNKKPIDTYQKKSIKIDGVDVFSGIVRPIYNIFRSHN